MKIYVGNLSYDVTDEDLNELFKPFGNIKEAFVMRDKITKRSKGFGFVEMEAAEEAEKAISELHESEYKERNLTVNEAKPKNEKGFHGNKRRGFQSGGNFHGAPVGGASNTGAAKRGSGRGK